MLLVADKAQVHGLQTTAIIFSSPHHDPAIRVPVVSPSSTGVDHTLCVYVKL